MTSPHTSANDERLDAILHHLQRLDRRDRLRTWGGFVRGLLGLIPLAVVLYSMWYLSQNWDKVLTSVAQETAKQTAIFATDPTGDTLKELQKLLR
ncbi:MAG: hypothetical protein PHW10_00845 [Candidatus Peribacteraceae bacterium]|nr:hypothetical protein [Candidatus Peribacteraceae bacterium]